MEKLSVHFPLGGITDQRSINGADLSLFGSFCQENVMGGNSAWKCLEFFLLFSVEIITVHTAMPVLWHGGK